MTDGRWQRKASGANPGLGGGYIRLDAKSPKAAGTVPIWNKAQWTPLIYHGNAARTSGPRERRARRH